MNSQKIQQTDHFYFPKTGQGFSHGATSEGRQTAAQNKLGD